MAKILIVEDDFPLSQTLMSLLGRHHDVIHAPDIATAEDKINLYPIDVAIIDRQLPDGDGLDLLPFLEENSHHTRTLMLTNQAAVADRIEGLQIGADDYLAKPFDYDELILRIQKLLQVLKVRPQNIYQCGPLSFETTTHTLKIHDEEWHLRKKEAQLLTYFMQRINQIITREDLLQAIWNAEGNGDVDVRTVDVNLRRLRLRLGAHRHLIQCIRGAGYRLVNSPA